MSNNFTTASVQEFLKDFLANSETQILEEGKEKNDILEVAQARGYNLKDNLDLAGFKTIFTFADKPNANKARLPKDKLLKALPGMIGKPVDIDHIRNFVVGHYIDYRYKAVEDMVVAYGVFYKSNFGTEWDTAKKLFKAGKLGTSYEVWCPKNKRKYLPDGTYELTEMEIAGGGLMFKEKPAFPDALVLNVAKKCTEERLGDLVMASTKKYDNDEIITSAEAVMEAPVVTPGVDAVLSVVLATPIASVPQVVSDTTPIQPIILEIPKIKCGNCQQEFDNSGVIATQSEKNCPHCKAILTEAGTVKYPPQIIDFGVSCPSCHSSNWKLLKTNDTEAHVKCASCTKEYNLGFEQSAPNEIIQNMSFVYIGSTSCPQCGNNIAFSTTSKNKNMDLSCKSCDLKFNVDIAKMKNKRKVSKINEVADLTKASAEGGEQKMAQTEEVPNLDPKTTTPSAEVVVAEVVPVVDTVYEVDDADAIEASEMELVEAKVLTTVDRNTLPDSEFAVVKVVKNKKTGENRKIRMYPINDEAHVRNALARVNQDAGKQGLEALGVSVAEVKAKIEAKAKTLNINLADVQPPVATPAMTQEEINKMQMQLCTAVAKNKKLTTYFKAAQKKIKKMKASVKMNKASIDENESLKTKIQFLETSAVKILERKNVLGEYGKDISEKDILDDDKFEMAKVKKENEELKSKLVTSSAHVAVKSALRSDNETAQIAKNIDTLAFSKQN